MATDFLIPRLILMAVSIIMTLILIKVRHSNRIGNPFFVIVILFWLIIFIVAFNPNIISMIIESSSLENRAQFLLIVTIPIVVYLLYSQTIRNKNLSLNFRNVIRRIAISNFSRKINSLELNSLDLIIVIAAKNEEKTIGKVIEKIKLLKLIINYKIIVINDGSSDDTENIAENSGAIVINHFHNLGLGAAIKTGFIASYLLKPKIIINLDADDQHNPKYIPQILTEIKNGADMVYCSRFSNKNNYKTSTVRLVGIKFYNQLVNKLGDITLTDVTSGYRGIRYEKLKDIFFTSETNFAIELALRAAKNRLNIVEIPVEMSSRLHGHSQFFRLEKFFMYNINAIIQIFNSYFKHDHLSDYDTLDQSR
jgi:hypothetical protein